MTVIPESNESAMIQRTLSPRYCENQTSAGRSTLMIIESSSYVTTPGDSPPSDVQSAYPDHSDDYNATIAEALSHADSLLRASIKRDEKSRLISSETNPTRKTININAQERSPLQVAKHSETAEGAVTHPSVHPERQQCVNITTSGGAYGMREEDFPRDTRSAETYQDRPKDCMRPSSLARICGEGNCCGSYPS